MCGLVGVLTTAAVRELDVQRMAGELRHRGPDDSGAGSIPPRASRSATAGCRSSTSRPRRISRCVSACGRYVIVFNGEIYNYRELRRSSSGGARPTSRGHSDTEVLLAGFERWGIEATPRAQLSGMFAFALWDRRSATLHLARDRLGEKPLYYGWHGGTLPVRLRAQGAARASRLRSAEIDRDALGLLPAAQLRPGAALDLPGHPQAPAGHDAHADRGQTRTASRGPTGSLGDGRRRRARRTRSPGRRGGASTRSRRCCAMRCGRQMVADVPLGAFLSGGIDSSTVVALMQAQSARPVRPSPSASTRPATTKPSTPARSRSTSAPTTPSSTSRRSEALDVDPAICRAVRRAVRRLVADPDLPGRAAGAAARHRGALRRRRRRAVRRLQPLRPAQQTVADRLRADAAWLRGCGRARARCAVSDRTPGADAAPIQRMLPRGLAHAHAGDKAAQGCRRPGGRRVPRPLPQPGDRTGGPSSTS